MFPDVTQKILKKGLVCKMKKRVFKNLGRAVCGAFLMIGVQYIIALCFSKANGEFFPAAQDLMAQKSLLEGAEMLAIYSALAGAVFGGMRFIWEIEDWSVLKSSAVYFGINLISMSYCGYKMYWFTHSIKGYLPFLAIFVAIFLSIWCMCYFRGRSAARQMNRRIREKK